MEISDELSGELNPISDGAKSTKFPPALQKIYEQLINPDKPDSNRFRDELKKICSIMRPHFGKRPLFDSWLPAWNKRRKQFTILESAIEVAETSGKDLLLLLLCRQIASENTSWFSQLNSWNALPRKIKFCLQKYFFEESLAIDIFPFENNDFTAQKYMELLCTYTTVHQQMVELQEELQRSTNLAVFEEKINDYEALCGIKDGFISALKSEVQELQSSIQDQQIKIEAFKVYAKQNQELEKKLEKLVTKINKSIAAKTMVLARNQHLELQVEQLTQENQQLSTLSQNRKKIITLEQRCEQLDGHNHELIAENTKLKAQISRLHHEGEKKEGQKKVVWKKPSSREDLLCRYAETLATCSAAADQSNRAIDKLSAEALIILRELDEEIHALMAGASGPRFFSSKY
ncbi:MAG: hypothetical protein H0U71_06415 [Gammaproteobacteria bacterium]|nr:hypothetical protein [Gammaproteobacteria bacterium]